MKNSVQRYARRISKLDKIVIVILAFISIIGILFFLQYMKELEISRFAAKISSHRKTEYEKPPLFLGDISLSGKEEKRPFSLWFSSEQLYVTYLDSNKIGVYSSEGRFIKFITPAIEEQSRLNALIVNEGKIYGSDFLTGEIKTFTGDGKLINSYGWLPNKNGRIKTFGLDLYQKRLYVTDLNTKSILVISTFSAPPYIEEGELILTIPMKRPEKKELPLKAKLKKPTFAVISKDGRILVSDARSGLIKVYTCAGYYINDFQKGGGSDRLKRPAQVAYDSLSNPKWKKAKGSVDPSGVRSHGRVHVVDNVLGKVFIYTTTGQFISTYGTTGKEKLSSPNGIAVNTKQRIIYIADTGNNRISVFGY